jgi:hypothetical protein
VIATPVNGQIYFIEKLLPFLNPHMHIVLHPGGLFGALEVKTYEGPPLFVNSDACVNTARLHTHVPLECSWYDSYQHWWCVRFERSAALFSVWTFLHQCMRCSHSPSCPQTPMALLHSVLSCSALCSTLCSHSPSCPQTPMAPGISCVTRQRPCGAESQCQKSNLPF